MSILKEFEFIGGEDTPRLHRTFAVPDNKTIPKHTNPRKN
jgi:hypothetical protein